MKKIGAGILAGIIGSIVGATSINYLKNQKISDIERKVEKFKGYYNLLNQWMINKNEGKKIEQYFNNHGYNSVAIYGMGEVGNRLYEELKNTEIVIKYAIDKNADTSYSELKVVELDERLEKVDVIIVTAFFDYDKIMSTLEATVDYSIISIEDIIYEL